MEVMISLHGSHIEGHTATVIQHNAQTIFTGVIVNRQDLNFNLEISDGDLIRLNIDLVKPTQLMIGDIQIDNISLGINWLSTITNNESRLINESRSIELCIEFPLYNWIINNKFIKFDNNNFNGEPDRLNRFAVYKRFEYDKIITISNNIRELLNDKNISL